MLVGISGFFLIKYYRELVPEVRLSYFLTLLKNNGVQDCLVVNEKVYFKGLTGSNWYSVNVGMLTKDMMFKLLLSREDINVSCQEPFNGEKYIVLATCKFLIFLLYSGSICSLFMENDEKDG